MSSRPKGASRPTTPRSSSKRTGSISSSRLPRQSGVKVLGPPRRSTAPPSSETQRARASCWRVLRSRGSSPASTTTRNGASFAGSSGSPPASSSRLSTPWRKTERSEVRLTPVSFRTGSSASARWMNLKSQVSAPWTKSRRSSSSRATRTEVFASPRSTTGPPASPGTMRAVQRCVPSASSRRSKDSVQECDPDRDATRFWSTSWPSRKSNRSKAGTSPDETARIRTESV